MITSLRCILSESLSNTLPIDNWNIYIHAFDNIALEVQNLKQQHIYDAICQNASFAFIKNS